MKYSILQSEYDKLKLALSSTKPTSSYFTNKDQSFPLISCFLSMLNRKGNNFTKKLLPVYEKEAHFIPNKFVL